MTTDTTTTPVTDDPPCLTAADVVARLTELIAEHGDRELRAITPEGAFGFTEIAVHNGFDGFYLQ